MKSAKILLVCAEKILSQNQARFSQTWRRSPNILDKIPERHHNHEQANQSSGFQKRPPNLQFCSLALAIVNPRRQLLLDPTNSIKPYRCHHRPFHVVWSLLCLLQHRSSLRRGRFIQRREIIVICQLNGAQLWHGTSR